VARITRRRAINTSSALFISVSVYFKESSKRRPAHWRRIIGRFARHAAGNPGLELNRRFLFRFEHHSRAAVEKIIYFVYNGSSFHPTHQIAFYIALFGSYYSFG